ncbi:MAG: PAS domain S-box protein, partial [Planctomycetes bacterium]|nr:PAS domain S-box protein [Planctomycetota bacterium]
AVEQSSSSIVITDVEGIIEYVNPRFTQLTGYSREEVMGKTPRILKSGEHDSGVYKSLWDNITSGKEWRGEL